jgi:CRP/FNR family transcriptional regulator, cyclic AMP receptor protein
MTSEATPTKKKHDFNPNEFFATIAQDRTIVSFPKKQTIFSQGAECDAVFYIREGKVRLAVVSKFGKEATIGILSAGDFLGEECLAGRTLRLTSATTIEECFLVRIEIDACTRLLRQEQAFSDMFIAYLLERSIRYEEDLADQLFNFSEKRLARALLLLARYGKEGIAETMVLPKFSQETLAEMVGATRSRVSVFVNKFRKLGFVDYDGGRLEVHSSLLNVLLHD